MKNTNYETMTVQQALGEGFEHWLPIDHDFQSVRGLSDITPSDIVVGAILVDKSISHPVCFDAETIIEDLAENIACNSNDDTGDDTDSVFDAVKSVDPLLLTSFIEAVQEKLNGIDYYKSINVKLVAAD